MSVRNQTVLTIKGFCMLEEEYQLEYFKTQGLTRKVCKKCGSAFWTRDNSREICGDAPCEPYDFIGKPVFERRTFPFLNIMAIHG
jgi:ribosomal protein S27AE